MPAPATIAWASIFRMKLLNFSHNRSWRYPSGPVSALPVPSPVPAIGPACADPIEFNLQDER
jgi:hypothetical protein